MPAEYRVLRDAYRVLFTSKAEKRLAEESFWLHRWNPYVVPYGASGPKGDPELQKQAFFERCPTVKDRRYLLFLGRIHRKKGCDLLIDAFAKVAADDPSLDLVMAGPDQQAWSQKLQQMAVEAGIGDRIHWPGMVTGDAKWGAFHGSEAFILPSHQENFGIAVAEALACGRPVLLADKVNIAEEIAEDKAGLMELDTRTERCDCWSGGSPCRSKRKKRCRRGPSNASTGDMTCGRMRRRSSGCLRRQRCRLLNQGHPANDKATMMKQIYYNAADHIAEDMATDPYLRPAFP